MPQPAAPSIFRPSLRKRRLERAAGNFSAHDFLHRRAAADIVERLETVQRTFKNALFYGPGAPLLAEMLTEAAAVEHFTVAGESAVFLRSQGVSAPIEASACALPFADGGFDLVASVMSLHAENDLPGALAEAHRVLSADGLFIGTFPAEKTLGVLRQALRDAEANLTGGLSPRVSPFVAIKDAGGLLQRAGFALPVADTQPVTVAYGDPLRLLHDLRGMGETAALAAGAQGALRRDVLAATLAALHGQEILFELLTITGWSPHESQQKPLKPGSGKVSLADAIRGAAPQSN